MSFITTILPLSLEQYLANNFQGKQLPIAFSLSEQALTLTDISASGPAIIAQTELVVFQELTLSQLVALQKHAQFKVTSLTTINHRNNQTSCRFQVNCDDFIKTRKAVADFALENKIEAALLSDVPKLAVPGLLVMDMDSTTIEIECIDEIAKLAGVGEEVAEVTERAMLGELDFAQSLHQRVATLADSPESILSDVAKNIPLMAGLKPLIIELKKHNWRIAIASGGFTYFADHLKETLKLDAAFANTLEIVDGKLTGKVLGSVVDAQVKADSLAILSKEYQIAKTQTVAMGDGANDLVMMAAASFGVAFHAKPIVLAQADSSINVQGLDCLLHWLA
ncbi:phosphoserine phosphatase SerB [Colwellia psychrerythraea]|uniref:Phosphoserine phosphatase n=1 Tax=Colwellia psychrerythraea TaxID=28229 RepID=A0A099KA76_COLPS|nr:phosphoserine phosphatase SerB [Colwellia psychrerythraea]KGJ87170.1 phosphoserine phosphatase SerB [Colwellia psychrerythraea]